MNAKSGIGASVARLEDLPLVTGRGRFAGDIVFPELLHMRVVRSGHANGLLRNIDLSAAIAAPGVVAVWTSADIDDLPPIEFREGPNPILAPFRQSVLGRDRVRYVGEPVAAVFAEDAYAAEDAADLVALSIEELPVVTDAAAEPAEFASGLTTEPTICRQGYGDIQGAFTADRVVVELDLSIGRHSGVPLETRGAIAVYDAERDMLKLYGAAKVPHRNRETLAKMFKRDKAKLHLYEGHTGGGFGVRGEIYPEDILVLYAAMRLRRPVKWLEDRREHMVAANQSRQQRHKIRAAVARDGTLAGIDDTFFHDQGAYIRTHGTRIADMSCGILPGPYRLPHYRAYGHFRLTNKTPAATYRSPGRYEVNFVRERMMDAIAAKFGLSRIEVRRRNLIAEEEMPYERPLSVLGDEVVYDSGNYRGLLDKALAQFEWERREHDAKRRRQRGEYVGLGIAMYVEKSGLGPRDGARVEIDQSGAVEVVTGGASLGQGFETVMAQICAEKLGADYRSIRVIHGQTDRIEHGIGAHATRATVMTGNAVAIAANKMRKKLLTAAAPLLQAQPGQLDIADSRIVRSDGKSNASITFAELVGHVADRRGSSGPPFSAEGWFTSKHMTYPYGVQLVQLHIDGGTGKVTVQDVLIAFDVGRAVNPVLVHGQLVGGFVQGLGGALLEEFQYDERGQPLSTTFADYLLPTASDIPAIDILLTEDAPSARNPLGIKGAGEGGIAGVGAVIASAVDDALGAPGAVTTLPITPRWIKSWLDAQAATG